MYPLIPYSEVPKTHQTNKHSSSLGLSSREPVDEDDGDSTSLSEPRRMYATTRTTTTTTAVSATRAVSHKVRRFFLAFSARFSVLPTTRFSTRRRGRRRIARDERASREARRRWRGGGGDVDARGRRVRATSVKKHFVSSRRRRRPRRRPASGSSGGRGAGEEGWCKTLLGKRVGSAGAGSRRRGRARATTRATTRATSERE